MLDRANKAAKPPKTDDWSARENDYQSGTVMLLVSGKVEVTSTNKEAKLAEASGDGSILVLDLTIETGDYPGADVVVWAPANFSRRVGEDEFREVHIRWDGKVIGRCRVIDDDQAHARLVAHTEVANVKAAVKITGGKVKKTAKAVLDKIGKAVATPAGKAAAGATAVAAVGAAAVATAVSLGKPKAKKKAAKKTAKKSGKKSTAKKSAAKKAKAGARPKAKAKAKTKTKAKTKKAAPKKAAKRGIKKANKKATKKTKRTTSRR